MSENLPALREQQQQALERGDRAAANAAYALELQALTGQAAEVSKETSVTTFEPAPVDRNELRMIMSEFHPFEAEKLLSEWGTDRELAEGIALACAIAEDAEIIDDLAALGIADDPRTIRLLAKAAARLGYRYGGYNFEKSSATAPWTASPAPAPGATSASLLGAIAESNKRISALQAEGRTTEANHEYQRQQAMISAMQGNGPIVDGRRTA